MFIPKGNVLFDEVQMPYEEFEAMLANLKNDGFTGYVLVKTANSSSYIFINGGVSDKVLDVNGANGTVNVYFEDRFLNRLRSKELLVSTYVLSGRMVDILSLSFTFQQQYMDYEVRRRDMTRVLEGLESGKCSGIIKVATKNGVYFFLVSGGEILNDRFSRQYGEIICGLEEVKARLEEIEQYGATISVYAEKEEEIDNKRRQKDEELDKLKDLMIKQESGLFRTSELVKVEEYIVREWGLDTKSTFNVEIETQNGDSFVFKCQAGRKMGGYAGVTKAMMERMKVAENETIFIRPI